MAVPVPTDTNRPAPSTTPPASIIANPPLWVARTPVPAPLPIATILDPPLRVETVPLVAQRTVSPNGVTFAPQPRTSTTGTTAFENITGAIGLRRRHKRKLKVPRPLTAAKTIHPNKHVPAANPHSNTPSPRHAIPETTAPAHAGSRCPRQHSR